MVVLPIRIALALSLALLALPGGHAQPASGAQEPFAYSVDTLSFGLDRAALRQDLTTPQASLEYFLAMSRDGNHDRAAYALNLSRIAPDQRAARAPDLARKLAYVIDSKLGLDWSQIPDRPDGAYAKPRQTGAPPPRRTLSLGSVELNGREIPINLQRFAPADGKPVWLFSPYTVAEVPSLYRAHGPGILEQWLPDRLRRIRVAGEALWIWLALGVLAAASAVAGWLLAKLILALAGRADGLWPRTLRHSIGAPLTATLMLGLFAATIPLLVSPTGPISGQIGFVTVAGLYLAAIWLMVRLIWGTGQAVSLHYRRRLTDPEHAEARRARTKISVALRIAIGVAIFTGLGLLLAQFEVFDTLGLSLLASAGAVTVILSIAARPFLENMVAGLQIAATEPVRIGDTLLFEGHWGTVESIAFTYVTVHTWDLRRVIVPHTYLLTHPFENWSKESECRKMVVHLLVDHRADIDALRDKYLELVDQDPRWEGEDRRLEVVGVTEEAMDLRVLACGRNSGETWNLHCHIREQLMKFLQNHEDGRHLVRRRQVIESRPGEAVTNEAANGHDRRADPPRSQGRARPDPDQGDSAADGAE